MKIKVNVWNISATIALLIAVAMLIVGPVMKGFAARTYDVTISVFFIIGIVLQIVSYFFKGKFMPLLPVIAYAVAFGLIAYSGSHVIADHYNGVNYVNGDYASVCVYCVLGGLCLILSCIAAFDSTK